MPNTFKDLVAETVHEVLIEELLSSDDPTPDQRDDVDPYQHHASPWCLGKQYLIRTATMTHCGFLVGVYPNELVLEEDAWVADTGRFNEALRTGKLEEVEPFPDGPVIVGRNSVIDAAIWNHPLPREVI